MNQKILFLAAGIIVGITTVYVLHINTRQASKSDPAESAASAYEETSAVVQASRARRAQSGPEQESVSPLPAATAAAPLSAWARLAQKYGVEKTAASSNVTSNLTSLINEGIELANTAAQNSGSATLAEAASKQILRNASSQLGLSEEQHQQAAAVLESAVNRRLTSIEELTYAMSAEPEHLMEMLLAGDALARNQITQAEYDQMTLQTRAMLQQMTGFGVGRSSRDPAAQFLLDPETTAQLNAILEPDQQVKLAEMTATLARQIEARQASQQQRTGLPFQLGEIPVMEIERLDQTVASMRQMTEAARLMMDAMKVMKEANPGTVR
jgi:hypothetical protein